MINGIKDRLTDPLRLPYNFVKGPIIGWDAPKAFVSDMGFLTMPQLVLAAAIGGSGPTDVLCVGDLEGCDDGPRRQHRSPRVAAPQGRQPPPQRLARSGYPHSVGLRSARAPIAVLALASTTLFSRRRARLRRPQRLDRTGRDLPAGATSTDPQIAVDAAGNLTAAWTSGAAGSREIRSASRPVGGPWETSISRISSAGVNCETRGWRSTHSEPRPRRRLRQRLGDDAAAYRPANGAWTTRGRSTGLRSRRRATRGHRPLGQRRLVWSGTAALRRSSPPTRPPRRCRRPAGIAGGAVALEPNVAIGPTGVAHAVCAASSAPR